MWSVDDEFGSELPQTIDEFAEENAAMEAFIEEQVPTILCSGSRKAVLEELLAHLSAPRRYGYICLTGRARAAASLLSLRISLASWPIPRVLRRSFLNHPCRQPLRRRESRLDRHPAHAPTAP